MAGSAGTRGSSGLKSPTPTKRDILMATLNDILKQRSLNK